MNSTNRALTLQIITSLLAYGTPIPNALIAEAEQYDKDKETDQQYFPVNVSFFLPLCVGNSLDLVIEGVITTGLVSRKKLHISHLAIPFSTLADHILQCPGPLCFGMDVLNDKNGYLSLNSVESDIYCPAA